MGMWGDGGGWEGMRRDGKNGRGSERMEGDGRAWERDGSGCERMEDGRGWEGRGSLQLAPSL